MQVMLIIHAIAEEAMKQEQSRSSTLHSKADNLVKHISIIIGFVNSVLVFLLDRNFINGDVLLCSALWINTPFLLGLLVSVFAQRTFERLNYPSGLGVLHDIAQASVPQTEQMLMFYQLRCMGEYTEKLSDINNERAHYITLAYLLCFLGFLAVLCHGYSIVLGAGDILWCQIAVSVMGIFFYWIDN